MKRILFTTFYIACIFLTSCASLKQEYDIVKIGNQNWMSKNLDVATFRNGDTIVKATNIEEWENIAENKIPAWCYHEFNYDNGTKYGKLYNWYAVNDKRGLAPQGFRIPTENEWVELFENLGDADKVYDKLKSIDGWRAVSNMGKEVCPDCQSWSIHFRSKVECQTCKSERYIKVPEVIKVGGNNSSGFTALPFGDLEDEACWWTSSEFNKESAWAISLYYSRISRDYKLDHRKDIGFSVRCIKD